MERASFVEELCLTNALSTLTAALHVDTIVFMTFIASISDAHVLH